MAVDFCDYFWGEEHNGWNVLYQNMKQGHNASKELAEFFKERWSVDESYCKALLKLANKASINSEKGTLTPLFALLKTSSEKMSTMHLHMVNRIQDLVKDIVKYNEELHKKHKQVKDEESQTEDVVKTIQATGGLAQKAKETYNQRCQDLEKAKRDGASPKDIEKAESKLRKAHDEYKMLVDKYNSVRDEFEKKMLNSCRRFQGIEETHLSQILLFIQTYIYVLQTDQNAMGQILQELMNKYSEFTIDRLLDTFALSKLTGLEKPVMMVFEDTCSLGSAISGQQSPDPAEQSKSSADDASSLGGIDKGSSSGGGVLAAGRVREEGGTGVAKESRPTSGRTLFSLSKASSRAVKNTNHECKDRNAQNKVSSSAQANSGVVCQSRSRPITYRRPESVKTSRRTTSLLNLFMASSNMSGQNRELSAPPKLKNEEICSAGEEDPGGHGSPHWPPSLPSSPDKVTSAPSSPTGGSSEAPISRSIFRSSKWFLRSRRDKKKEKKAKKKKDDSSSNKDEKSDNENSEDAKTADLLSIGPSLGVKEEKELDLVNRHLDSELIDGRHNDENELSLATPGILDVSKISANSMSGMTPMESEELRVDDDGYTIPPLSANKGKLNRETSFDSSSDSDSEIGIEKKIHVEIKPITNGAAPISASVDELRATIEGMDFSPMTFATLRSNKYRPFERQSARFLSSQKAKKGSIESQDSMKRCNSVTQQFASSSQDLLGLNLTFNTTSSSVRFGGGTAWREAGLDSTNTNGSKKSSVPHLRSPSPYSYSPRTLAGVSPRGSDRYAELSEILGDSNNTDGAPPVLPPRGSTSRGSTPTPTMAIPRPASRKSSGSRGIPSPATVSTLSRAESASSLEFRTSGIPTGISRGPSPLTIGMSDTIPLAVAFQELCHAYFRGTDESKIQMKVTGEMMVSFPAGIVGVLANNPSPAQLSFKVQNYSHMNNPLPNKQLITFIDSESSEDCGVYNFDMTSLSSLLRKQAEQNPTASYFNVDIIKYQVGKLNGSESAPLHMVSYWRCEDAHTDLRIDYSYNNRAMSNPSPLLNISVSVPIDGLVKTMQSKPTGQWLKDQQKAVWKITELSQHSSDSGKGSLRGKFEVMAGPTTPTTINAQFNCEGTTLSGVEFALAGSGYRVSLIKKRFVSGKYICDADAVLRHRYGSVTS